MRKDELMEDKMMIFHDPEFGQMHSFENKGIVWFLGKDAAAALGYTNTAKAIRDHVDDEDKLTERFVLSGQKRQAIFVNESGLYSLILSSKLSTAKAFKRWVTSVILPSIRRHGAYVTDEVLDLLDEHPEWIPEYITRLRDENANARAARQALEKAQAENALLAPKAAYYDSFVSIDSLTNIRYTAKELCIPQKQFIGYLLEKGYLYRDHHRRDRLFARAGKRNDPLFMTRDFYLPDGTKSEYTLVTPAGKAHFLKKRGKILAWAPKDSEEGEELTDQAVLADEPRRAEEPR